MASDFEAEVYGVSALAEPARLALYRYVVAQPHSVSRDEAAAGVDLPRHAAKFHLDRLVDEGLLDVEFRRLSGRTGPGAGRPAKLYRRSGREVSVTLPERRYELAGRILSRAVASAASDGVPVLTAVTEAALHAGRCLGEAARQQAGAETSPPSALGRIADTLGGLGYEPRVDREGVELVNCPFHALAQEHTQLICGMNLSALDGLLEGLGVADHRAALDPGPGRCCVRIVAAGATDDGRP